MALIPVIALSVLAGVAAPASAADAQAAKACSEHPSRVGSIGGIQWAQASAWRCSAGPLTPSTIATQPNPPYKGSPPLTFHGGVVAGTATAGELTVTPVYWVPSGGPYSIPAGYESLINRFITDAAAASGKLSNVFSSVTQYTSAAGTHLKYLLHASTPVTDTTTFPSSGCSPDSGTIWSDGTTYSECLTNAQLLAEASSFTTSAGLPNNDLAHLYMYFLPEGVETCFSSTNGAGGGTCTINASGGLCGYHAFAAPPLVADMAYAVVDSPLGWTCSSDAASNTGANESPNGNIAADTEIDLASHEISETITDPEGSAWYDAVGNEDGDDCRFIYGDSSSWQGTQGALWEQTINGHHYFIQEELSNQDYKATKTHQYACIQSEDSVAISPKSGPAGTAVTLSGGGFLSFETVTVAYFTGLTSPTSVVLCSAVPHPDGTFSCSGTVPTSSAGSTGSHKIVATGGTSKRKPKATYKLT